MIDEISKEILEVEPYKLLLTIHDAMIVPESFSEHKSKKRSLKQLKEE